MKKLFTLFAMCFAFVALNAQNATINLTAGDVWGDGTGYQLLISSTPVNFTDTAIWWPECNTEYNSTWNYKIPANASGLDNTAIIMNSTGTVEVPAGTYSYVILNPSCMTPEEIEAKAQADWAENSAVYEQYGYTYDDIYEFYLSQSQVWPASMNCDAARGEMAFEAGKTYTFALSMNGENDCTTLTVTGTGVAENEASFGIYPNPANDVLNVKANDVKNIEILNMLGQTVITTNVNTINVANLTNGVYFVRVNFNNGEVSTQKFVKE